MIYRTDKWLSKVRAPFENVFSKADRRTIYRGTAKVQMQVFLEAIVHNVKRLLVIEAPPLFAGA
ncbi:MAG: transposase [Candidatus Omnitrophica bacterium]|nr:transposase [Candidatus Omnitrophota bacterium]